jgi:hypothetical protein
MMRNVSNKLREVQNPMLQGMIGFVLVVLSLAMMLVSLGLLLLLPFLFPVLIVLHLVLRASGRKGFVDYSDRKLSINVDTDDFRKA